jgi:hypothetical protein
MLKKKSSTMLRLNVTLSAVEWCLLKTIIKDSAKLKKH